MNVWLSMVMLNFEAANVVALRALKLAAGGSEASAEAQLMATEKVSAAVEALGAIVSGASPAQVIERYRELVAANAHRLTACAEAAPLAGPIAG